MAPLVFIWLGSSFPHWGRQSLTLSKLLSGLEVVVISNKAAGLIVEADTQYFIEDFYCAPDAWKCSVQTFDSKYRDGFWIKTTERFFVLEQFATKYAIKSLFHAELDNLVFDISGLASRLDQLGSGLFCPRDSVNRGIASLIYINNCQALTELNAFAVDNHLVEKNDMMLLGYLLNHSSQFFSLPTESNLQDQQPGNWDALSPFASNGIFDAAAIGQFLFGIDPRYGSMVLLNGFENENKGCNLWQLTYDLSIDDRAFTVRNRNNGIVFNLFNVHVHSKLFNLLINSRKLQRILTRINCGKKSIVNVDLMQNRICRGLKARLVF